MLAVVLVSPFLAVDNFAVAAALGLQGIGRTRRALVLILFGGMGAAAIVGGELVGSASSAWLGSFAQYAGGVILVVLGAYQLWQERGSAGRAAKLAATPWALCLLSVGVSLDTLVAGVAFGLRGDPILASAVVVGGVTAALSLCGLKLGGRIARWQRLSAWAAPVALVGVGVAIGSGLI
ncbi:MAG: manganese efflux pump [Chloroflexi bacterium]|nr:manganese efflux pump [Chloroflexota bacterium]